MKNHILIRTGHKQRCWKICVLSAVILSSLSLDGMAQVGLGGQISAANYFEEHVIVPTGQMGEVAPDGSLPVDRYAEFKIVVLAEAISLPASLDISNSWNSLENQVLVRNFVDQGGIIVIFDSGFPIIRDDPVSMADLSDFLGFKRFESAEQGPALIRSTEGGTEIFSDPAWQTGLQFPQWHSPLVSFPAVHEGLAEVLLMADPSLESDSKEVIMGTVNAFGEGKVYWFRWSPMRIRNAANMGSISPEVADLYEQSLANLFTEN